MNLELSPKLLDVVEFTDSSLGSHAKRTGTVVETLGESPTFVLIEVTDSQGLPESFHTKKIDDIDKVWEAKPAPKQPDEGGAQQYFESGFLYLQNGLVARAKEQFARAFSLQLKLRASLLEATNVLARKGRLDAAIRVYALLLELQPEYEIARENLAAAYVERGVRSGRAGLLDQAIDDFKSALMLRPKREESVQLIRRNLVAGYTHVAVRHSDMKLYSEAVGFFVLAFELEPSDLTQRNLAIALIAASTPQIEAGSQVPGQDFFKRPIQMGLTLSECLNVYGATLARHGRIPEALSVLEKAVQADSTNQIARKNLETLLHEQPAGDLSLGLASLETREMHLAESQSL